MVAGAILEPSRMARKAAKATGILILAVLVSAGWQVELEGIAACAIYPRTGGFPVRCDLLCVKPRGSFGVLAFERSGESARRVDRPRATLPASAVFVRLVSHRMGRLFGNAVGAVR